MEVELKFLIEDSIEREKILYDSHLAEMMDEDKIEEIEMKAVYFDTEDFSLCDAEYAFRVRAENDHKVATLKWGGKVEEGLHTRGELNVPVDENFAKKPYLEIFKGSDIYDQIMSVAGGKELKPLMEVNCLRKQITVDTGKSISVISLDVGQVVTPKGTAPVSEVEVELFSGDKDDMMALGRELQAKYNLTEGAKSKFRVGLELIGYKK